MVIIKQGKEKQLLRHHPWIFSGAIEKAPVLPGIHEFRDSNNKFIGWGYYDRISHIPGRLLSWEINDRPDDLWWEDKVAESIRRRKILNIPSDSYRVVHGEADFLPGLAVDVFADTVRVLISARIAFSYRENTIKAIQKELNPDLIVMNTDEAFRSVEGLPDKIEYYKNGKQFYPTTKLDEIEINENGIYYSFTPGVGQKSGFFCDQRANRMASRPYFKDSNVLDAFCYTGAFSIHALKSGAKSVVSLDASADALSLLKNNINLNISKNVIPQDSMSKVEVKKCNVFEEMRHIDKNRYDVMVLDPPKLAKTKKQAEKASRAYKDLNRLAMEKIKNGGVIMSFSCSGSITREDFRRILAWASQDACCEIQILETLGQSADHPIRLSFPESEYLKGFIFRVFRSNN